MSDEKELSPEEVEKQQKEQKNKVENAFNQNIEKITAILQKAPSKSGKRKVPGNVMEQLVAELFKEDDEKTQAEFKAELRILLEKYVKFWSQVEEKEREIEKIKNDGMKDFNQSANKLFGKVDSIPELMKKYAEGLRRAAEAGSTTP
jgi:hypothetical protein